MVESIPIGLCQCGCGRQTSIAKYNRRLNGYVKGIPLMYVVGHRAPYREGNRLSNSDFTVEDRGHETPCWIWAGSKTTGYGYGRVVIRGQYYLAHRAMYTQEVGPIARGLTLDHLCEIKACVNPAHLEVVTIQENIRRRDVRRRKHR